MNQTSNTPARQGKTIDDVMFSKGMLSQVQMAAPKHLDADRIIRLGLTTIKKNKDLMNCWNNNQASVLASFMESVQLGLEIDTRGLAYLIPYKGSCTFQVGYKGLISLAMRSGKLRNIYAEVVYESEKDNVNIELGLSRNLTHKFDFTVERKGNLVLAYAVAVFLDGTTHFEYVQPHHIEKAKKTSMGAGSQYSPWNTHTEEMWKKTAIKRLCKYLDLSPEVAEAIAKEEEAEIIKPPVNTATVIDMTAIGSQSDMSIYEPPPVEAQPAPEPSHANDNQPFEPSAYDKAIIKLSELASVNQKLVDKHLAGRNADNMTADELYGVIDGVEDEMK